MTITWQEPPTTAGPTGPRANEVVALLKQNPGRWALVETGVSSTRGEKWKRRGCIITTRATVGLDGPNRRDVYACWPADA